MHQAKRVGTPAEPNTTDVDWVAAATEVSSPAVTVSCNGRLENGPTVAQAQRLVEGLVQVECRQDEDRTAVRSRPSKSAAGLGDELVATRDGSLS